MADSMASRASGESAAAMEATARAWRSWSWLLNEATSTTGWCSSLGGLGDLGDAGEGRGIAGTDLGEALAVELRRRPT